MVEDVTVIDLDALRERGIRGFVFDLDNTIMAPRTGLLEARIEAWLAKVRAEGFGCIVLSNNKKLHYCQAAEKTLGIPVLSHAAKPSRKKFREALKILGLEPEQVAIVGDRPLTDIWAGQRIGSATILVDPLIKHQEKPFIKFLRRLEHMFVIPHTRP